MRSRQLIILLTFIFFMVNGCVWGYVSKNRQLQFLGQVEFCSSSHDQSITSIKVAIADSYWRHKLGLMHVTDLKPNQGMLFVFDQAQKRQFWMAETPLPLDIMFVNADQQIIHIHHHAEPYSHDSIGSHGPAKYVVETNAGFAKQHHIKSGMYIDINLSS